MKNLIPIQKNLLNRQAMCEIEFRDDLWSEKRAAGWTISGDNHYDVVIANDLPNSEITDIVLIHELAHVEEKHNDIDFKKEFVYVRYLFKTLDVDYKLISKFGGPMKFLNIALDLRINSKYLTPKNINLLKEHDINICTLENDKVKFSSEYRGYYSQLIEKLKNDEVDGKWDNSDDDENDQSDVTQDIDFNYSDFSNMDFENSDETDLTKEELDEIRKYLNDESKDANDKDDQENSTSSSNNKKSVKDYIKSKSNKKSKPGKSDYVDEAITINNTDPVNEIANFIRNIVVTKPTYERDIIKLYNRQCRDFGNGLLYPSRSRRPKRKQKKKLAIILDTSGSMNVDSIIKALSSLNSVKEIINAETTIFQTNTRVQKIVKASELTPSTKFMISGGTDMVEGVKKAYEAGFNSIIVYSDFETDYLETVFKKYPGKYYAINVNISEESANYYSKGYFEKCEKVLNIKL